MFGESDRISSQLNQLFRGTLSLGSTGGNGKGTASGK